MSGFLFLISVIFQFFLFSSLTRSPLSSGYEIMEYYSGGIDTLDPWLKATVSLYSLYSILHTLYIIKISQNTKAGIYCSRRAWTKFTSFFLGWLGQNDNLELLSKTCR